MLHMAAHARMHGRSTAADPYALDVLRDLFLRRCFARCTLLDRAPTHTADVEPDLVEQLSEPGSASRNVKRILASSAAPTHLRARTVRACVDHGFSGQLAEEPAAFTVSTTVLANLASVEKKLAPKATNDT